MEIPLTYITTGVCGGLRNGFKTMIYGLDEHGMIWAYDPRKKEWKRVENPRTGTGKSEPDQKDGEYRTWKEL